MICASILLLLIGAVPLAFAHPVKLAERQDDELAFTTISLPFIAAIPTPETTLAVPSPVATVIPLPEATHSSQRFTLGTPASGGVLVDENLDKRNGGGNDGHGNGDNGNGDNGNGGHGGGDHGFKPQNTCVLSRNLSCGEGSGLIVEESLEKPQDSESA